MAKPRQVFTDKEKQLLIGLYKIGATDQQVADCLGMLRQTLIKILNYTGLSCTIKAMKSTADLQVEQSLFKRAVGYEYEEITHEPVLVKGVTGKEAGKKILYHSKMTITKIVKKEVAPDPTACFFWLCNRQKIRWQNIAKLEHSTNPENPPVFLMMDAKDYIKQCEKSK